MKGKGQMKAAVLREIGAELSIEVLPVPEIESNEVLVKTKACGICGTDIHIMNGWGYLPELPHILGHEPAGIVVKVGDGVRTLKPGDRVIPNIFHSCGSCHYCLQGRETLCDELGGITGVTRSGAFAECFKASEQNLFILPDEIDYAQGCVIADAVVTAVHAVRNADIQSYETVAVIGAGGVGQIVITLAGHQGADVFAFDVNEEKLVMARRLGAQRTVLFGAAEMVEALKQCDVIMECVGRSSTLQTVVEGAKKGARIIVIGYENEAAGIRPQLLAQKELLLMGSRSGTKLDTFEAIRYVQKGILQPYISDYYELKHINQAIRTLADGKAKGRVVITFED